MFKRLCNNVNSLVVILCHVSEKSKCDKTPFFNAELLPLVTRTMCEEQMLQSGQKEMWFTVEEVEVHCLLIGSEVHEQTAAAPCLQERGTAHRLRHLLGKIQHIIH